MSGIDAAIFLRDVAARRIALPVAFLRVIRPAKFDHNVRDYWNSIDVEGRGVNRHNLIDGVVQACRCLIGGHRGAGGAVVPLFPHPRSIRVIALVFGAVVAGPFQHPGHSARAG